MSQIKKNDVLFDTFWMDMFRGLTACAIVIHHWLLFVPHHSDISLNIRVAHIICNITGTMVHLFFIISGAGLTISYYKNQPVSWGRWCFRRFERIVIPYWIVVTVTLILVDLGHVAFPGVITKHFSWQSLLAHLSFTRNFHPPSFSLNPALWYMPVIVGLYLCFPLLIRLLQKTGLVIFLAVSLLLTIGSIVLCLECDYPVSHQTAIFPFYLIEFSLGMALGRLLRFQPHWFGRLICFKVFCLGVAVYVISALIIRVWTLGALFNDVFTTVGLFCIFIWLCRIAWGILSPSVAGIILLLSNKSYLIYMIHLPLILFVINPLLKTREILFVPSLLSVFFSILYCLSIVILSCFLSPTVDFLGRVILRIIPLSVRQTPSHSTPE